MRQAWLDSPLLVSDFPIERIDPLEKRTRMGRDYRAGEAAHQNQADRTAPDDAEVVDAQRSFSIIAGIS